MHLLSSEKIYLSMTICRKCLEHSVVFQWRYVASVWNTLLFFNGDLLQVFGTLCCFLMAICRKCLEHSVVFRWRYVTSVWNTLLFFQWTFFEATCISCFRLYPSAEIPRYEVFSHPSWELKPFFWKALKVQSCKSKKH